MSSKYFDVQAKECDRQEQAILVGLITQTSALGEDPLEELTCLAQTAGAVILGQVVQKRARIHPATYIGRGKLEELKELCSCSGATLIIFDDDLSPAQARNIEKITECRVIDRSELILDIFAAHARTRAAKLQVELAQLEYALPRLRRMWTHLDRYEGGIGLRGPGEKQIEVDRRLAKKRIADLTQQLRKIQARKTREVQARNAQFTTMGLVGYTNAGKSTLMNRLTGAQRYVADQLFATLETKTRLWTLRKDQHVLLSDTVGFIRKLPHHLIASFKATLEEVKCADVLLHVVDISHPQVHQHIQTVKTVLEQLHYNGDVLMVFNKHDLLSDPVELNQLRERFPKHVVISAKLGEGLDELQDVVLGIIEANDHELTLALAPQDGKVLNWLASHGHILEQKWESDKTLLRVRLNPVDASKVARYVVASR